jgi:phosphoesterase RecJ-like protein
MDFNELKSFFDTHDNYLIMTHKSPDGDTLGSAFALCGVLRDMGKKANIVNNENLPVRYNFLYEDYYVQDFEIETVVAVDIADEKLFGSRLAKYEGKVDLCIDHHISNTHYAKHTVLDAEASAAALVLYEFFRSQGIAITALQARCLYTGIATDTGCFKFENTTPKAHMAAADLMRYDFNFSTINRKMFDIKSKQRLKVEEMMISEMEYYFDDRCTMICLTTQMMNESGVEPAEFEGLASIPLSVEGVVIGITIKQRHENVYKLSVRTTDEMDASVFCRSFGGGGHIRAAGCEIEGTLEAVKDKVLKAVKTALEECDGDR